MANTRKIASEILKVIITGATLDPKKIAKSNSQFKPNINWDMWFRVRDLPSLAIENTLCDMQYDGIFEIIIFVPPNKSDFKAKEKADEIIELFTPNRTIETSDLYITIRPPHRSEGMNTTDYGDNWYAVPISIFYHATT